MYLNNKKEIKDKPASGDFSLLRKNITFYDFLTKKAEKLTTALYLVTDFISDNEPIKNTLRARSIDVLLKVSRCGVSENNNNVFYASGIVMEILSLLEVSVTVRLISRMNFEVLKKEYESLQSFLQEDSTPPLAEREVSFSDSFFRAEISAPYSSRPAKQIQIQGNNTTISKNKEARVALQQEQFLPGRPEKNGAVPVKIDDSKRVRQEKITAIFQQNNALLNVKDIASRVAGYSEKTLQRDLIDLVGRGILKKVGERRWSRYCLNT